MKGKKSTPEEIAEKIDRKEAERNEFFDNLSVDQDGGLRDAVMDVLSEAGGSLRLNLVSSNGRVKEAKAALFPRSGAVSISSWLQRRMPDLVVEPDPTAKDNQLLRFAEASPARERPATPRQEKGTRDHVKKERTAKGGKGGEGSKGGGNAYGPLKGGRTNLRQAPYAGGCGDRPIGYGLGLFGLGAPHGYNEGFNQGAYGKGGCSGLPRGRHGGPYSFDDGCSKGKSFDGKGKGKGKVKREPGLDPSIGFEGEGPSKREIVAAEREAFFDSLSPAQFSRDEGALLDAFLDYLTSVGGSARLNTVVGSPIVKEARARFLPKSIGVSHWICCRAASQLAIEPDPVAPDNQIVSIIEVDSTPRFNKGERSSKQNKNRHANEDALFKGKAFDSKGKGKGKVKREPRFDAVAAFEGEGPNKGEIVAAEREAFFESLSPAEFSEEEAGFLEAFLDQLTSMGGSARLNTVTGAPIVKEARARFLPKSIGISHWICRRVANHLAIEPDPVAPDNQIVSIIKVDPTPEFAHRDPRSKKPKITNDDSDAFFEGLPSGDFTAGETMLVEALLAKLETEGGSCRLNTVVSDPSVKQAKAQALPQGIKISHWIGRRLAENLKLEPDPTAKGNQLLSAIA